MNHTETELKANAIDVLLNSLMEASSDSLDGDLLTDKAVAGYARHDRLAAELKAAGARECDILSAEDLGYEEAERLETEAYNTYLKEHPTRLQLT